MPWGVLAAGVAATAATATGVMGANASKNAASDQEQAALAQLGLNASVFNAQGAMSLPTREVGGEAQAREAYLLGLDPNLNISADFSTPNISAGINGSSLSWSGPGAGDPTLSGQPSQGNLGAYYGNGPTGGTAGTNAIAAGGGATPGLSAAPGGGGPTNPNAIYGGSGFGSFASPYNPSTFYQDPGYQFIQQQGLNTISNQQATSGMALAPSSLSAALQYSSGLASQEFNNAYSRSMNTQTTQLNELNALSSGGQIATSGLSTAAGNFGAAGSSALAGYGNAAGAGAIGASNAYSSGLNGIGNAAMYAGNYFGGNNSAGYQVYNPGGVTPNYGSTITQGGYTINTPGGGTGGAPITD